MALYFFLYLHKNTENLTLLFAISNESWSYMHNNQAPVTGLKGVLQVTKVEGKPGIRTSGKEKAYLLRNEDRLL